MASRLQLLMASVLVWLPFLMCVVYGQASIRVKEIQDMDPSQGDTNSIGILNTIYTNNVGATTTRGLLIDAGSGGSRIHVYEWGPRIFQAVPPPISYPTTNEKYTGRISNGVQLCWREGQTEADLLANIKEHLAPLVDFARAQLAGMEDEFATIPIWFKATGGARELTASARQQLMTGVRQLLSDKDVCPFYFHYSMARIISGEEEAVFSWACMNFLYGHLIPESQGMGQVITGGNSSSVSYGTIDLGGSSTQIAFYLPSEDIMEGL
jgi:Golgi nucleoside diphosphatase